MPGFKHKVYGVARPKKVSGGRIANVYGINMNPPAKRIVAYVTWGNLNAIWSDGATLHTESSLDLVTDIVGPAVNIFSTSNPYMIGMYGDLSMFTYIADAAADHGISASPYLFMDIDDLVTLIDGGKLSILVGSVSDLLSTYGLDGINLDVEGGTNVPYMDDLVEALYAELQPMGKKISMAAQYGQFGGLDPDISTSNEGKLDYIAPMCYDLWSYADQTAGYPHSTLADSEIMMAAWVTAGFSKSKLCMGIPFYGKSSASTTIEYRLAVDALDPADSVDSGEISGTTYWWGGIDTDEAKALAAKEYAGVMLFALGYDKLNTNHSLTAAINGVLA